MLETARKQINKWFWPKDKRSKSQRMRQISQRIDFCWNSQFIQVTEQQLPSIYLRYCFSELIGPSKGFDARMFYFYLSPAIPFWTG